MSITRQAQGRAVTICYPQSNPPTSDEIASWIAEAMVKKGTFKNNNEKQKKKSELKKNLKKSYGGTAGFTATRRIGGQQCIVTVTMCYEMGNVTDEAGVKKKTKKKGTGSVSKPPGDKENQEKHRKDLHRHEIAVVF